MELEDGVGAPQPMLSVADRGCTARQSVAPPLLNKRSARMSRRAGWLGPSPARLSLLLAIALIADGCATSGSQPGTMEYKPYKKRAQTQAQGDLIVTVALPTATEAAGIYGADLAEKQIQPVWIEVRNDAAVPYWFLISGLDPNYFAASEAAHAFHATTADGADRALDERFDSLQFRNPVMPGATASGFVLTNLDEGVKVVDVDLIARGDARSFTFVGRPELQSNQPAGRLRQALQERRAHSCRRRGRAPHLAGRAALLRDQRRRYRERRSAEPGAGR